MAQSSIYFILFNSFIICFASSPFRSWPADFGHVAISGIITVLLVHGGSEYTEMLGDATFHCILHNTTGHNTDDRTPWHVKTPTATTSGPLLMTFST